MADSGAARVWPIARAADPAAYMLATTTYRRLPAWHMHRLMLPLAVLRVLLVSCWTAAALTTDDGVLAWSPPSLITVGRNATATERFAAGSLESRLRATLGLATAHVAAASAGTAHKPQLAVGFRASLAAGVPAEQLQGLGDDGYILLPLKQGGVALAASANSARGSMNAVYGLLRAGACASCRTT